MSRRAAFVAGSAEHHWPPAVGMWHHPELVETSKAGSHWFNPGRLDIPLQIHELPHEMIERHGVGRASGAPIDVAQDPRIPSSVYHVTTDKPAVLREGLLRASGGSGGGLGGVHSPVVSLTTDRRTAMQLHTDVKFAGELAAKYRQGQPEYNTDEHERWGRGIVATLKRQAHSEGWRFTGIFSPHQHRTYGLSDMMTHFHMERSRKHPGRGEVDVNPILTGGHWERMDPSKVGIVRVPKANIARTGALVTDFDLRRSLQPVRYGTKHGLHEIRVHGDVPL